MAVFYKDGKRITFGTSKNNKTKFIAKQNKDTSNALERDGITFGNVTNAGKKAIEENTLDSYIPETEEEKKTIENYKLYLKSPTTAKASYETAKVFADVVKNTPPTKKEETSTTNKETTPVTVTTPVVDTNKGTTDNTTYKGESVLKDTPRTPTKFGIKPVSQWGVIEANTKNYVDKENERATINFYEDVSRRLENTEEGFDLTYAINYAEGLPKEMRYAMRNVLEDRLEDKKAQMNKKYKSYGDNFLDSLKFWKWTDENHPMPSEYISERNGKSYDKDAQEIANLQSAINTFDKYGDAIDLSYDELKAKRDSLDKDNSKENEERLYYQTLMNKKHYESVAKEMSTIMVEIDGKEMSVLEAMQMSADAKDDATKKKIAEICKPIFSERGYLDDDFASDVEKTQNRLKAVFEHGASLSPRYPTIPTVTKKRADFVVGEPVGGYEVYYSILTGDDSLTQWDESLKSLVQSAKKGLAGWSYGIGSTFDNLLGAFGWDKNPFHYASEYDKTAVQNAEFNKNYYADRAGNPVWLKYANDVTEGVTGALPDVMLTLMTAGAFKGGTTTKALQSASASANATSTLAKIGLTTSKMAKNPNFWMSFARTCGTSYEHAKETGASDEVAWFCAILESLINASIEVGIDGNSGYQGLINDVANGDTTNLRKWVYSTLSETGEEGFQGLVSRAIQKYGLGENVKVLDEIQIAYEMAMGTVVGGVLGAPTLVTSALSTSPDAQLGKEIRTTFTDNWGKDVTNDFIEDCIKKFPTDSEVYKLATEAKKRIESGKKVSNDMLGKIYRAGFKEQNKSIFDDDGETKNAPITFEGSIIDTEELPPNVKVIEPTNKQTIETTETPVTQAPAQTPVAQTPSVETTTTPVAQTPTQEATPVKVGETYTDTKNGDTIKIISRDDTTTTVEMTDKDGNVATREFDNNQIDLMSTNPRYAKADVIEAPQTAPVSATAEESASVTQTAETPTQTAESFVESVYVTKVGNNYEAYGENAKFLAEEFDRKLKNTTIDGVKTSVVKLTAKDVESDNFGDFQIVVTPDKLTKVGMGTREVTSLAPKVVDEAVTVEETPSKSVEVGDVFYNRENGDIIKVVGRDGTNTTVETQTTSGVIREDTYSNDTIDFALNGEDSVFIQTNKTPNIIPTTPVPIETKVDSLSVGDTFVNTKGGTTFRVVARDSENTTIEKTTKGGKVSTVIFTNQQADGLITNPQYQRVVKDAVSTTEATVETIVPPNTKTSPKSTNGTLSKGEINTIKRWDRFVYFDNGGSIVITDGRIALDLPKEQFDYVLEEYAKANTKTTPTPSDTIAKVYGKYTNLDSWGEVTDVKGVSDVTVKKGCIVCIANGKGYLFAKNYYNLLKKHSNTISVVGDKAWTIALVGYDKNGNPTGMVMPIKNENQTIDGIEMYTGNPTTPSNSKAEVSKPKTKTGAQTKTESKAKSVAENSKVETKPTEAPTQASQNAPKSSETDSVEQTPTEIKDANTEQSVSETEATKTTTKKPKTEKPVKSTKKEVKAKTVETTVKLDDFGEKIGGARKDQWSSRGLFTDDLDQMNDREREKNVKKDNVWKRPNYQKLIEAGGDRDLLWAVNEIRKSLNQNIYYGNKATEETKAEKQKVFIETIREIQSMAENAKTQADFEAMGEKWLIDNGYLKESGKLYPKYYQTQKFFDNPALAGGSYFETVKYLAKNFDNLSKLADRDQFAVDTKSQVPKGFSIVGGEGSVGGKLVNGEWVKDDSYSVAKGRMIIKSGFATQEEALAWLKEGVAKKKGKTRFIPQQLLEVHRKGADYRDSKSVNGQDYIDTFGFKGGEFGNWMSAKDRQVSLDYGYDALKDLADALGIEDTDISLGGNLNIAFGARGQGLSGGVAHYETARKVINLTKMKGAGSLAHEWFHSLDDFIGGYTNDYATDKYHSLPENTKQAIRDLITTMQYKDGTQEETDLAHQKRYEQAVRGITYTIENEFRWVEKVEKGTLNESDSRYYKRTPTIEDAKKYRELFNKLIETGEYKYVESLSDLRKEINGHVISKEVRDSFTWRLASLNSAKTAPIQLARKMTDFYKDSRRFGQLHSKDGDYWDSTVEMSARAFACYVADKTNKQNDYLSAHSDSAVTLTTDKDDNPVVVRAYPVGEERTAINKAFDNLIEALKSDGFLHEKTPNANKPKIIQYSINEESENFGNEQTGNNLLFGNSRRTGNESTQKQAEGLSETERKRTAEEILSKGQTEQEIVEDVQLVIVKEEAYNEDMTSIAEKNKTKGLNTHYFLGNGTYKFDTKKRILTDGIIVGNDVYLRYDGKFAPQVLNRHENIHNAWDTEEVQEAYDKIWNSLSKAEQNAIFKQERYKKYAEIYKGNMELVKQEFIADVLAGMTSYTNRFADTIMNYWNNAETVDNFKVSEYTHSTDAGGKRIILNGSKIIASGETLLGNMKVKDYNARGWSYGLFSTEDLELLNERWKSALNKSYPNKTPDGLSVIKVNNKVVFAKGTYNNPIVENVMVYNAQDESDITATEIVIFGGENYVRFPFRRVHQCVSDAQSLFETRFCEIYNRKDYASSIEATKEGNYRKAVQPNGFKNFGYVGSYEFRDGVFLQDEREVSRRTEISNRGRYSGAVTGETNTNKQIDQEYLSAVERGDTETAQKMVDKKAKESGYTVKAYHGTPNNDFTVFDKERIGKGTDQYGAGFYFATNKEASRSYGERVIDSLLSIKKPFKINGSSSEGANLIDAGYEHLLTEAQAYKVIKRLPNIYDPENSILGDYYDAYWEVGAEEWMIRDLASNESYRNIGYLDSDLFRNYPNELHEALRDVVGYDGIEVTFDNGDKFYVAWFDTQMKSADPITYDDEGDIIPLSQRFDSDENDIRYSSSSFADTFYSHMAKVVDDVKQDKLGADSVVPYLKGKGVKAEEIKWSGIESWLEGKKSVTKAELQEFVAGSMLQIEETIGEGGHSITLEPSQYGDDSFDVMRGGAIFDTLEWDESLKRYVSDATGLGFSTTDKALDYYKENNDSGDTRWSEYTLDGGTNYREFVFKMPNSSYTNTAMKGHWGNDAKGVLAHARVQDFETKNGTMLFIEEIQSDWHNEGSKLGYGDKISRVEELETLLPQLRGELVNMTREGALSSLIDKATPYFSDTRDYAINNLYSNKYFATDLVDIHDVEVTMDESIALLEFQNKLEELNELQKERRDFEFSGKKPVPDAPFRNNYHEYVLKRLIREAVEKGYDSIGWTTADIQSKRWSDEYAEGYRIEYDQDIPKFLNKYGKKWGAKVETTTIDAEKNSTFYFDFNGTHHDTYISALNDVVEKANNLLKELGYTDYEISPSDIQTKKDGDNTIVFDGIGTELGTISKVVTGTEIWSMPITDAMKQSVLYEGQPLYSTTDESVDTDTLSKEWDEALEKYGAIKKGETPTRDIDVPQKRSKNEPISLFARTALEAGITPDAVVDDFQREVMYGKMAHEVITDKKAEQEAIKKIEKLGFEGAINNWDVLVEEGKIGKNDFVFGMVLYNQAITNKDYKLAMKLISDLSVEATNSAQVLQSIRMLKKMSPDGTLYYLEKSVEKMNEEFREQLGEKFKDIEIDPELMKDLYEAKTEEERNKALEKIEQNIADQIPSKLSDKVNAWRYFAMLGNLKTHGRNVFGNMTFWATRKLKNAVGTMLEKFISKDKRTKSIKKTKESVEFAKEDVKVMKDILTGTGGKYEIANKIQQKRKIFETRWLEFIRRKNFDFLEAEDWWFLKSAYQDSLAQLISARKIDVNFLKSGTKEANDLLNKIRAYAINEAKEATFRQASELGNAINRAKRNLSKGKIGSKAVGVLLEGTLPFTNVPINIAKQGVAYSPWGLVKGVYEVCHDVKKGDKTASEAINTLSKGLTGSLIMALGVLLRAMGILVAEVDDDDKKNEHDKMNGKQSYALQIGDHSYTIDWFNPSAMPLFVGVELYDLTSDGVTSVEDVINALSRIGDPMIELSVLQGVSDALTNAKYTEENPFVAVPVGMITSYIGQYFPTLGGQFARLIDDKQRKVYIEKGEGFLTGQISRLIQTIAKKIPLASTLLEPQINAWGEEKTYGSMGERIIESTISPGYHSEITSTEIDDELNRLFEATGENSVYPASNTVKSITVKKQEYKLTASQSTEYARERGQRSLKYVTELMNKNGYKNLPDEKKVKRIEEAYEKAKEEAKDFIFKKYFKE